MPLNQRLKIPQAVIFDMDGLLLDSEVIYGRVWEQAAVELGYSSSLSDYLDYVGRRAEDCDSDLQACYGTEFPISLFWQRQVHLYNEHRQKYGVPLKPGAEELLDFLRSCHIPAAVATSTHREEALLGLGDLASLFDVIVTGDEVSNGKPNPEIFLLAAQRLNTAPTSCLVLEDAEAGVRAANAASMPVIIVPDLKPCTEEIATYVTCICSSLFEVKAFLSRAFEERASDTAKQSSNEQEAYL